MDGWMDGEVKEEEVRRLMVDFLPYPGVSSRFRSFLTACLLAFSSAALRRDAMRRGLLVRFVPSDSIRLDSIGPWTNDDMM